METALEQKMDDTMKVQDVRGVVCTDLHGLCLGQRGAATKELAGPIAALCDEVNKQWPSQVRNLLQHSVFYLGLFMYVHPNKLVIFNVKLRDDSIRPLMEKCP